ncbi:MAG: molybdopterin-dependent oxidoreductase [Deltaproteobacteria bacterium]|nr:molybdopterin-dependent oxidoreductase [Deltaproteobacteria bacterium]
MDKKTMNLARARIYQFLSTLYRDEIPLALIEKMSKPEFLDPVTKIETTDALQEFCSGLSLMGDMMKSGSTGEVFNEVRYDYAELFLNAGKDPAFPYQSCYLTGEPLVMQEPVFKMREIMNKAGLHKSEEYKDLDDHIAAELELMRYFARQAADKSISQDSEFEFLNGNLQEWAEKFSKVLTNSAKTSFYRGVAKLTAGFLNNEKKYAEASLSGQSIDQTFSSALGLMDEAISTLELTESYLTLAEGAVSPEGSETIKSHCFICLGLCGQEIKVKDNIITGCKGLKGDPKGGGRLCIKGAKAHHNTYSAYRLKTPLIRENGRFRKAGWDEALDMTVKNLNRVDPSEVGFHRGNDWNNWCHEAVMSAYGTPNKVTHRQMCDNPARMANEKNFSEKRPWIDYENSEFILLFGINELATSAGQRKVTMLKAAVKRGAKLVVVDPRRSETAKIASEWIAIKPGTDGAMAMAMCYVLVKEGFLDNKFIENWTYGFNRFKKRLLGEEDGVQRTPEWAAEICGISAGTIERLAHEFAAAAPAVGVNSWTGVTQAPNTFHATQALIALNALVGSFDAPGGPSLIRKYKLASPWADDQAKPPNNAPKTKLNKGRVWSGWIPAYFEKDVDEGKLKAMLCYFGDPVMSSGSEPSIRRAVEKLEFSCSIDCYMSNTTELCDVVLPDCTYLEQSRVVADWMYESFISLFQRAIKPMYDCKSIVSIFQEIANRLGFGEFFPWKNEDEFLQNQLRNQPVNLEELRKVGYYITDEHEYFKYKEWGSMNPPAGYGSSGNTTTGKYNFMNPLAEENNVDGLPDYKEPWAECAELKPDEDHPMILGFFRVLEHEHTSTYWNPSLMKAYGTNPVWVNYVDAKKLGIADGDAVKISSPWSSVEAVAKVTWGIREGVLAAAGGFGHKYGLEGDPKYPQYGGFNTSILLKPNITCEWTATPPLKYIKTRIEKI